MASPQLEDGYFRIANEIAEALMRTNLSPYQSRVLWAIFRRTYGFQKKEDWISNSQLCEMTVIHKAHISRTLKELQRRNMVTKGGKKISFNKDYQQWRELPKGVTTHHKLPKGVSPVTEGGNKSYQGGRTQKKERNYTKEKATPSEISSEISALIQKLFPLGKESLFQEVKNAIVSTRNTRKISDNVLLFQLRAWDRYPILQVHAGIRIYLEKQCYLEGKDEKYLLGIIRRLPPKDKGAPPHFSSTGSLMLDDYYRKEAGKEIRP